MKKRGSVWKGLTLLSPKNLAKEVHIYGYNFSWNAHSMWILGALTGSGMLGVLFHLQAVYVGIILIVAIIVLPILVLDMYKRMYEQKRFSDVVAYMEQMLYSFQKTGKVTGALKETKELFSEGLMRQCIDAAILHMEIGKPDSPEGVLTEGLRLIEKHYACEKLRVVHELLRSMESYGGEAEESILLVLEDIEHWKKREYQLQAEKKKYHTDNVISIVVAVILCAVALYTLEMMRKMFGENNTSSLFLLPVIQFSSTIFILLLLGILIKSTRKLTEDWLNESGEYDSEYILHSYELVMRQEKKKRRKGMGYRLAKKDVTEAMYLAFPQWLTEMMLLLQHNNVQVALVKSVEGAPVVLQGELVALRERMARKPGELQTYTAFCQNFDLPEVEGCMKMLHAFSENGAGNVSMQMNRFLAGIGQLQERADAIRDEKIAFRMKLIFSYPVLAAIAKLLADLTVAMAVMLQVLGRIGGM